MVGQVRRFLKKLQMIVVWRYVGFEKLATYKLDTREVVLLLRL